MVKELEDSIGALDYRKRWWGFSGPSTVNERDLMLYLQDIKKNVTENDYYIFLAALRYSREIVNDVFIWNNGDIDIKEIKIVIPSPFSGIADSRDNNIVRLEGMSSRVMSVDEQEDRLIVDIPFLRRGDSVTLNIRSRENRINGEEIVYDFKNDFKVNVKKMVLYLLGVFVAMFGLTVGLKEKSVKS